MREATRSLLEDMESWPWFEHVGEPIRDAQVIAMRSWGEALESARSAAWKGLMYGVHNVTINEVTARDWHRSQDWDPVVDEVKQVLEPLSERIRAFGLHRSLPEAGFFHVVRWDLIHLALATEFADLYPPLFGVPVLMPWYRAGHFPCGWDGPVLDTRWDGQLPDYRLHVF